MTSKILHIWKDASDEWRWSLRHMNGNILADGGEGYKNRADCKRMSMSVLNMTKVRVEDGKPPS